MSAEIFHRADPFQLLPGAVAADSQTSCHCMPETHFSERPASRTLQQDRVVSRVPRLLLCTTSLQFTDASFAKLTGIVNLPLHPSREGNFSSVLENIIRRMDINGTSAPNIC